MQADCPAGVCVDPGEDYDQPLSDQKFCVARIPPEAECNEWHPECPEGTKCKQPTGDGSQAACVPVSPGGLPAGSPCEKLGAYYVDDYDAGLWLDDCDAGSGCYFDKCRTFCEFDADLNPSCPPGQSCNSGRIWQWCVPFCSPWLGDCDQGFVCVPAVDEPFDFACAPDVSGDGGQVFDACEAANACDPGLVCGAPALAVECDQAAPGCCLPLCVTDDPQCPGAGQQCVEWYEPGMAPPGFENAGICRLPG